MTDNNIDTPQQDTNTSPEEQAFNGPWPTEESNTTSVEEAFKGSQESTPTTEETSPQQGTPQPTGTPIEEQAQEYSAKNDEKRFEYWQSQAAKAQNQLAQQTKQFQQIQHAQPQQQPMEEPVEQFPEPPARPEKPRNFSREEANADPSSERARYLDDYEGWRDDVTEYNSLRNEYNVAVMQDKFDSQEQERHNNIRRAQAHQAEQQQLRGVSDHLTGHYGMESGEANEFIQQMSDPNSLSLDNLVQLYRLQKGQGQSNQNAGPSPEFQQTQRAQQIPSPMGVQTGQGGGNDARNEGDKIMDNMITDYKKNNPW